MKKLNNIHPGEVLLEEFLKPMHISAYRLSKETSIPQTRISEIIKGKRSISIDTAIKFSLYFGNSVKFWIGLQVDYDIEEVKKKNKLIYRGIKPYLNKNGLGLFSVAEKKVNYKT